MWLRASTVEITRNFNKAINYSVLWIQLITLKGVTWIKEREVTEMEKDISWLYR